MQKIYKYLIAFSITLVGFVYCVTAQISDFITDSCYFAESVNIINRNITDTSCISEFGYNLGSNELLVYGIKTVNMGPHDAGIVNALDTTGLFFDDCHYHFHVEDWNIVQLQNECGEVVAQTSKIGWNLQDGGNMIDAISRGYFACFKEYAESYGVIDYSLFNHPPNDNFNVDTRMGMSAGYVDTYSPSAWGNSIKIDNLPNGVYYLVLYGGYSRYFNQGLNIFPDSVRITVEVSGVYPNRQVTANRPIQPCITCDATNPLPSTISESNRLVTWDSTGACEYRLERLLVKGNSYQISGVYTVTTNEFYDSYAPISPNGTFYKYRIGNLVTDKVRYR